MQRGKRASHNDGDNSLDTLGAHALGNHAYGALVMASTTLKAGGAGEGGQKGRHRQQSVASRGLETQPIQDSPTTNKTYAWMKQRQFQDCTYTIICYSCFAASDGGFFTSDCLAALSFGN